MKPDLAFADPRHDALGWRILVPEELKQKVADLIGAELVDSDAYEAHRIAAGVPRGGLDFMYGDAFPHETNMDRLHGVDFDKGCYVGQEVVSRMQHRGTARTRIVRVVLDGFSPETGATVLAGDKPVGTMGSTAGGNGLALLRTDRVADALDAGAGVDRGRPCDPSGRPERRSHPRRSRPSHEPMRPRACMPTARCAARGRAKTRSTWPITTPNGACRNMTTARCMKS